MDSLFFSSWTAPILLSALCLGFYDVGKKHAVRDNAAMPVLFLTVLAGAVAFTGTVFLSGNTAEYARCTPQVWGLLFLKSLLVSASWGCVYFAMQTLPISLAVPIRSSSPLWTVTGGILLYSEIPTLWQLSGMLMIFTGYFLFSILGKAEGFDWKSRGIVLTLIGTMLGAASALYDKYLTAIQHISRHTIQFYFLIDLVLILGAALLVWHFFCRKKTPFQWRWTIPLTGVLLVIADWLYLCALSSPEAKISILSLIRRSNCVISFSIGCWFFHDKNVKYKAAALVLLLAGIVLLSLRK